ncbi:ArsR/SmtB family transcription factor [Verminephrobacter aporrectodeae]|uniref:ArsR/SmtB family transcription factor n=1 Tax=Verminephrobacter aporrectodeae TaxID=1110389 RepID=UPI002237DC52|nr:winged helix-turn-helix domain-containing protein [Verminephrobacter aporrectodeae]MCW5221696.1 ArsR family transcriptional regulator [Verminephrobacter aporrectodeae subsp. tuberculatae]MCW5290986.1 ArsR family transcriptional regulator [Verminephrobacter aporrectodeae subsp. tuberculatae]MCW8176165.1 ArsR family transcriptional regulator [Verminephrobacter aporrectodeae subsp. tuberculatae]MCW8203826.1 ArsR family transcriptional regulator [Verminephrobacter aporrectodeae subsp. tuberculat
MTTHHISTVAHLIGEPVRSVMLISLADGGSWPAGALAEAAGVTAQTASAHLAKLLDGGLLTVQRQGRHRYYRLAGPHVVSALESLAAIGPVTPVWRRTPNRAARQLRFARCCYDHLAGQMGVAMTQAMLGRGLLREGQERVYALTAAGSRWLEELGLDIGDPVLGNDRCARQCLDWTERQHHLAGPLGARLMDAYILWKWMRKTQGSRALAITQQGWSALAQHFGIDRSLDDGMHALPEVSISYRSS